MGVGEWGTAPVVQGLLGSFVRPESRVRTMSAMTLIRNVGFTLGGGVAAWVAAVSASAYRGLVLADAVSFLVGAALLVRLRAPADPAGERAAAQPPGPRVRPGW